jgi:hypothetical protein
MASSTSSLAASPYPIGPKTQAYLGKMAEEISARGDGLVTDLDVWEAWKATKIPKVTLRVSHWRISTLESLLAHVKQYWLEARVFPREKTPDPSSAPLALRPSLSPSALRPCTKPSTQPDLSGLAHTPATYGRGASMRAILESINEDNECGNAGTTPTLARYLNGDEGGISAPIVSQNYYNEGVQSSRGGGVRVSDGVLELAIEIEALGVAGQADLVSLLIHQYCVVLTGTVTRCVGSTKAPRRCSYGRKVRSSLHLSSQIPPSASSPSWMPGRSNCKRCRHSTPPVWQRASAKIAQRMVGMQVRRLGIASTASWRILWAAIGS